MSWRPDPETLRWAAGQVLASGPRVADTEQLQCAAHHLHLAAQKLRRHAEYLESKED